MAMVFKMVQIWIFNFFTPLLSHFPFLSDVKCFGATDEYKSIFMEMRSKKVPTGRSCSRVNEESEAGDHRQGWDSRRRVR